MVFLVVVECTVCGLDCVVLLMHTKKSLTETVRLF